MLKNYNTLVRIVILNYNQAQLTIDLVNDINHQSYNDIEIVVVDNSCQDSEFDKLKNGLPGSIHLIRAIANGGYSKGNNIGCRFETSRIPDYYLILNNDIKIRDRDTIAKLVKSLSYHKQTGIVAISPLVNTLSTGNLLKFQVQVRKILPGYKQMVAYSSFLNKVLKRVHNEFVYKAQMPYQGKEMKVDTINGAAFMVDGDFFREIGFLDEGTFLFNEEIIFGKTIIDKGYSCLLNGNIVIDHLQGFSTKNRTNSYNLMMEKEKVRSEVYYLENYLKIKRPLITFFTICRYIEIYLLSIIK